MCLTDKQAVTTWIVRNAAGRASLLRNFLHAVPRNLLQSIIKQLPVDLLYEALLYEYNSTNTKYIEEFDMFKEFLIEYQEQGIHFPCFWMVTKDR